MPLGEQRNIIIGAARVFIGTTGDAPNGVGGVVALPTGTANTSLVSTLEGSASWKNVGFTQEGIELSYEPDYGEVEVDQLLDSARLFKQGMRVTANTTLAEATLENLLVVWGQRRPVAAGTAVTSVDILAGELGEIPFERSLAFVGPAPIANTGTAQAPVYVRNERVYWCARAIQTESTSFALRRSENTGLPASFRLLPYESGVSGEPVRYGRIVDRPLS